MKAKSKSKSAVVDVLSTEEMSKEQLEEHIVRLREELDREREEKSYFQLERDKIRAFWEICKRHLEEARAELRNREREGEEAEEQHRVEITVYKQKLKHVLLEQQSATTGLQTDAATARSLVQNRNANTELRLQNNGHNLQADFREKKLHNENLLKELNLKHQVELMDMANDYDKKIREIEVQYQKNMQRLSEAEEKKRRTEQNEIEDRMKSRIVTLVQDHDRALRGAEEYYSAIQKKLLVDQKMLKEELRDLTKEKQLDKDILAAQQENQRLLPCLQEAEEKLLKLQEKLDGYSEAKAKKAESRARVKLLENQLRDLKVEHELLLQAFEKVELERDQLLRSQMEVILEVQQRSGLKELLLSRRLAVLSQTLETREAQLCAALSASTTDPVAGSGAAHRVEEILARKQAAIAALRRDVARECKEYDELLRGCKERLTELTVPLHDFPFRSSEQILDG